MSDKALEKALKDLSDTMFDIAQQDEMKPFDGDEFERRAEIILTKYAASLARTADVVKVLEEARGEIAILSGKVGGYPHIRALAILDILITKHKGE